VRAFGIEITEQTRIFAESEGLQVFKIPITGIRVDTVVFLQSFEHLIPEVLVQTLTWVKDAGSRKVLISVPNASSLGYRLFGNLNPFHDPHNHPAIYSQQGLDRVFQSIGFARKRNIRIWSYTVFGILQSMLNVLFRSKNEFYLRMKRGKRSLNAFHFLISIVGILVLTPYALTVFLILFFNEKSDYVITSEYTRVF
jgi:hypothetical protein